MARVTEQLNFLFYFIVINLNVNSHMWLAATGLHSPAQKATLFASRDRRLQGGHEISKKEVIKLGLIYLYMGL